MKKIFYPITFIFLFIISLQFVQADLLFNYTTTYDNGQYASKYGSNSVGRNFIITSSLYNNFTIYNITLPLYRGGAWTGATYLNYSIYSANTSHQPNTLIANCNITGTNLSTLITSTSLATPTMYNMICTTPFVILNNTEYNVIIVTNGTNTELLMADKIAGSGTNYENVCTTTVPQSCNAINTRIPTILVYGINGTLSVVNITYTITNNASQNNISTSKLNLTIESKIEISSGNISTNTSSYLYYKINTTLNNGCAIFEQNICVNNGSYNNINMTYINNSHFTKTLYDNSLFPAYYPFNYNAIDNTLHNNYTLYSAHNILFNVTNFSTSLNYTLNLEFNAINKTDVVSSLLIYYCNSSYISNDGNPALRNSCELIDAFSATSYNHLHNNSKHQVVPVIINNVTKTQQSYFVFVGFSNILNGWNVEYITNSSYNNASFKEGDFNVFDSPSTNTNKIFDIHLHPFAATSSDFFSYYTIFNDNGTQTTSSINTLYYGISFNKVSASDFILPLCNGSITSVVQYTLGSSSSIPIDWTTATSQSGTTINYNLTITNDLGVDLSQIYYGLDTNYTLNSSLWNSLLTSNNYKLRIYSTDSIGTDNGLLQCLFNICENNYQPVVTPCISNTQHLYYYDINNCNEQILTSFPSDNNTYISCIIPATEGETNIVNSIYSIAIIFLICILIYVYERYKND